MAETARIAVFISGQGTDLQALIDASKEGELSGRIVLAVSNKQDAYGLQRAANVGVETLIFDEKRFRSPGDAGRTLLDDLKRRRVDYVALAGYLKLVPLEIVRAFPHRVINIHPALLPKFGGKGMYGLHVHEAVLASGDKETGVTIHLVDEIYDHGRILEQVRVPVHAGDTPESLAARVLAEEHRLYPIALEKLIKGEYRL